MKKSPKSSSEVRERAARMIAVARGEYPSQWTAIEFTAEVGCTAQVPSNLGC
ncbi:hypothetical protein [Thiomonas sp. FB-Cd]|uniref:hypothetical protein n=1 Tax=Thiomonas sp. FB-Cd TaxID=1158292 RepID=UPI0012DC6150|nr:hypothetical protein [Thiomonas sp. FB-Cd]